MKIDPLARTAPGRPRVDSHWECRNGIRMVHRVPPPTSPVILAIRKARRIVSKDSSQTRNIACQGVLLGQN